MIRLAFLLLFALTLTAGFSQSTKEKQNVFYPLNIPYAMLGRYQVSGEFGNNLGKLLIGIHYNRSLRFFKGKGSGFELQYRSNFNRDPNVYFTRMAYWGPYLEFDKLNSQPQYGPGNLRQTSLGLLTGFKINLGNSGLMDIYYGMSLTNYKEDNNYSFGNSYENRYTGPNLKAGIQLGIKF